MAKLADGPVRTGIAGLGRSGWDIHARAIGTVGDMFTVAAVFDRDAARAAEAKARFACATYDDYDALLADDAVELVVVAMPSHLHADFTIRALKAGKHVLCEKPMASSLANADKMIRAAKRSGRLLTVFQNRRNEPAFVKIKEVIASGRLGRIVEIKMTAHGFGRRWDWQTLNKFGGGTLRNNGPHVLDQALDLLGFVEPTVCSCLDRALTLGDADDHVKVVLQAPNRPLIDIELTSACPYPQEAWLVMGTQGGLAGSAKELRWKYFDPVQMPERSVDEAPTPDRGYNRETIPWKEESWKRDDAPADARDSFYVALYGSLRRGAPLEVKPEQSRLQMAVIEKCLRQSPIHKR